MISLPHVFALISPSALNLSQPRLSGQPCVNPNEPCFLVFMPMCNLCPMNLGWPYDYLTDSASDIWTALGLTLKKTGSFCFICLEALGHHLRSLATARDHVDQLCGNKGPENTL